MAVVTGVDTVGGFYILMSPGIIQWLMVSPLLLSLPQRKMSPHIIDKTMIRPHSLIPITRLIFSWVNES